jgi:hypothetical protein
MERVECMNGMRNSYTLCRGPKGKGLLEEKLEKLGCKYITTQVLQNERSVLWEVIVSIILSEKLCMYHILFLIPVFIAQVTKMVQFT